MFSITHSKTVFLLILNLMLIATSFGVDPIHFAGIMLLNLEIGMITPPFAANLFVGCRVGKLNMEDVLPKMIP